MKFNLNDEVVIYPTPEGWDKIIEIYRKTYGKDYNEAMNNIRKGHRTEDNGFKEQLHVIINMYGDIFFNGSNYITTADMDLLGNVKLTKQELRDFKLGNILKENQDTLGNY
jgi:hypothetical protein